MEKPSDLIGVDWINFVYPDDRARVIKQSAKNPSIIALTSNKFKIKSSTGKAVYVEAKSEYLLYQNKLCYISIIKDIRGNYS
jgi:hypothetical protein